VDAPTFPLLVEVGEDIRSRSSSDRVLGLKRSPFPNPSSECLRAMLAKSRRSRTLFYRPLPSRPEAVVVASDRTRPELPCSRASRRSRRFPTGGRCPVVRRCSLTMKRREGSYKRPPRSRRMFCAPKDDMPDHVREHASARDEPARTRPRPVVDPVGAVTPQSDP